MKHMSKQFTTDEVKRLKKKLPHLAHLFTGKSRGDVVVDLIQGMQPKNKLFSRATWIRLKLKLNQPVFKKKQS